MVGREGLKGKQPGTTCITCKKSFHLTTSSTLKLGGEV